MKSFFEKDEAIQRERELEKWNRAWKLELIERQNPKWKDLFGTFQRKLKSVDILDSLFRGNKLK